MATLGIYAREYHDDAHVDHLGGPARMIALEFADLRASGPAAGDNELYTRVVNEMITMSPDYYCSKCAFKAMIDGDFSHLSSATFDAAADRGRPSRSVVTKKVVGRRKSHSKRR
jgi:hypothetical protein